VSRVFDEWAAGWHEAETDNTHNRGPRDRDRTPDQQRGYSDYWSWVRLHGARVAAQRREDWQALIAGGLAPRDTPLDQWAEQ
jgi:hypothetical protein